MLEDVYDAIGKQMADGITLPTPLPESKDTHSTLESATDNALHSAEPAKSIISKHGSLSHLPSIVLIYIFIIYTVEQLSESMCFLLFPLFFVLASIELLFLLYPTHEYIGSYSTKGSLWNRDKQA